MLLFYAHEKHRTYLHLWQRLINKIFIIQAVSLLLIAKTPTSPCQILCGGFAFFNSITESLYKNER